MVNGVSVLGWGVGGIEAEAAMLGQPYSMVLPEVIGFKLTGKLKEGMTATDLVLTVTQMLRQRGVVGKFVEFFGPGLDNLSLEDRATIGNMAPEYGATCGFFPIDEETIHYLATTARPAERVALVRGLRQGAGPVSHQEHARPGVHRRAQARARAVEPSLAGPKRPQDRVLLKEVEERLRDVAARIARTACQPRLADDGDERSGDVGGAKRVPVAGRNRPRPRRRRHRRDHLLHQHLEPERDGRRPGCSPARRARSASSRKPWVKTSLAPGSQVVAEYLTKSGLQADLDALGFNLVGYGCTTCIGNSGPLPEEISKAINDNDLVRPRCCRATAISRPGEPGRARELSRLAAAGRRLCARRHHEHRPRQGAARHDQGGQEGLSQATSGRPAARSPQ